MDQIAVSVSALVHRMEELRLPVVPYSTYIKAVCIGIPLAVLVHDTAEYWLPTKVRIPVLSWFARKWRRNPEAKHVHLRVIRNLVLFAFFVVLRMDGTANEEAEPSDYVSQRLTSASGQRAVNQEIYKSRRAAFNAATAVLGEEEMNMEGVQQQRDAVLRRRRLHDPNVA
ncbi:conserved hypothetical protein [Leishmania infantum JPCM5]|uniref:Uncharacterized protein n=3 Tax=Leishmania donovani species complex TaxID=38574 RepID=A4IBW7_LEIIN|nr:conserved hypothetical protein [Leishmania infantum JPCM5]XP_003865012.1 hypothetical protein, conserved [Leishmania donovani]CAC9546732.1 hypothetical_protein_-_conserved [Leishmania infantum]AYU83234.1 hypothetical protein LdCL_350048500 [Leishmania donovani]TPP44688.1 hypothetical protein CGC21_7605 [Leishmania donovani]CAM72339.1 conserved hypothetical protein [Leishmania infantum JPCM5]CBZ38333.1 hypothetical protein, conserved [Leishmania donovani]|eukprot:XP_001469236.1 conserved hypothetical protein [Leishmania infantum JPCM5]